MTNKELCKLIEANEGLEVIRFVDTDIISGDHIFESIDLYRAEIETVYKDPKTGDIFVEGQSSEYYDKLFDDYPYKEAERLAKKSEQKAIVIYYN